jgi:hypothetical protein
MLSFPRRRQAQLSPAHYLHSCGKRGILCTFRRLDENLAAAAALFLSLNAPAVAQAVIPSLPKEMIGIWGFEADACDDEDNDGRLTVEAKRVASFASLFKLSKIKRQPDGTIRAAATRFDEGEQRRPRASLELNLVSPDKLSVKNDRDPPITYSRCKTSGKTG